MGKDREGWGIARHIVALHVAKCNVHNAKREWIKEGREVIRYYKKLCELCGIIRKYTTIYAIIDILLYTIRHYTLLHYTYIIICGQGGRIGKSYPAMGLMGYNAPPLGSLRINGQ